MPKRIGDQDFYSTVETAKAAGISKATLLRWLKRGGREGAEAGPKRLADILAGRGRGDSGVGLRRRVKGV